MLEAPSCFAFHVNNITTANASASSKLTRIHRKTGSLSARLVFETRAKCQEFVPRCKDDGTPFEVDSPFCDISTKITVRQSKSLEDLEIGKRCAPLWKTLATKLHEIFPERDTNDFFIVPVLDVRSQILSILDRKNGVFKLASPGHDSCSTLLLRVCAILAFLMVYYDRLFVKPAIWLRIARPMCDGRPSPRRFVAWRVEAPLFAVSCVVACPICDLSGSPYKWERAQTQCSRPYDTFVLLFLHRTMAWPMSIHIDANTTL